MIIFITATSLLSPKVDISTCASRSPLYNISRTAECANYYCHSQQSHMYLHKHVGHFLLDELIGCQWTSELFPVQCVVSGRLQAELCRSQHPPTYPIPGIVQATKRTLGTHNIDTHTHQGRIQDLEKGGARVVLLKHSTGCIG